MNKIDYKPDGEDDTTEDVIDNNISKAKLPVLKVVGRDLVNEKGEVVLLHGFAQTYSPFFNQNQWTDYDVEGCLAYNKMLIDEIIARGWKMDFVRMHMDPYWSDDRTKESVRYEGHERFSEERFRKYLKELFIPMAEYIIDKGMYVVFRPPGVAPERIAVGDDYNVFLDRVWNIVSSNSKIRNNMDIMFELANEPIHILGPDGTYASIGQGHFDNLKIFFQTIVNTVRDNCENIIWVPGLAYQSSYSGYANNPVEGDNIGYAIHAYPGWFGSDAERPSEELGGEMGGGYEAFQRGWDNAIKPVADFAPIMVTEMDWGDPKYDSSWGKSFTGTAGGSGFGANFKYIADNTGNVSWLLFTEPYLLAQFDPTPGEEGNYNFLNDPESCPWPIYHWFKEYASGTTVNHGKVVDLKVVGVGNEIEILTGGERNLIINAFYENGEIRPITADVNITSSNNEVIKIADVGKIVALKDGSATLNINYKADEEIFNIDIEVTASTFPLKNSVFNPSIFENGTFDENTKTLITGQYGFGGWQYTNGIDISKYKYLIVELGNDNSSGVSFRLFDENNYWTGAAQYDFGNSRKVVVEIDNMFKEVNGKSVKFNPKNVFIVGFWSSGNSPIIIDNIYFTDQLD